jgi:acyl transferase domain-containing protein
VLVTYSAHSASVLRNMARSHSRYLGGVASSNDFLLDYAFTQNCRRSKLEWRASIVASSKQQLVAALDKLAAPNSTPGKVKKSPKVCFMFCGQGAQYARMGLELFVFEPFRRSLQEADRFMQTLAWDFGLIEELRKDASLSSITNPHIAQPVTTAIQVAIVDLFRAWGLEPDHVVGHSSGEIGAAYAGRFIDRKTAWAAAFYRGQVAGTLKTKCPELDGGMMAVRADAKHTGELLQSINSRIEIACYNSPMWTTVSGSEKDLAEFGALLGEKAVHSVRLAVEVPYHSSYMNYISDDYVDLLEQAAAPRESSSSKSAGARCATPMRSILDWRPLREVVNTPSDDEEVVEKKGPTAAMYSSVTGRKLDYSNVDAHYWARNMTSPVRFTEAVKAMHAGSKSALIVEISPKATLKALVRDILGTGSSSVAYATVSVRDVSQIKTLLDIAGEAWSMDFPVNLENVMNS